MSRFLVASLVACSMVVVSAADVQAGLFGKRAKSRGCGQASSCGTAAPSRCTPAPAASCGGCSTPAPTPSCGGCGQAVASSGCNSCGNSAVSYQGVVTSGCANCSQTMNSGVIMESASPEAAPPAPAAAPAAPAAPATPTPDAAPSAPAAPAA